MSEMKWIPIIDKLPREGEYVLLSFSNFSVPVVGRFEDGAFYAGDEDETLSSQDMYVDASAGTLCPSRGPIHEDFVAGVCLAGC